MLDERQLKRFAESQGWTIEYGGKHVRWVSPEGETIIQSATGSDHRGMKNHIARLRRAGLAVPRKRPEKSQLERLRDRFPDREIESAFEWHDKEKEARTEGVPEALVQHPDVVVFPHISAILGQWRAAPWFDEDGTPLADNEAPVFDDARYWYSVQMVLKELTNNGTMSLRNTRIAVDAFRFWFSGREPMLHTDRCSCGHQPMEWWLLARHIVDRHERADYDHEPILKAEIRPYIAPDAWDDEEDEDTEALIAKLQKEIEDQNTRLRKIFRLAGGAE